MAHLSLVAKQEMTDDLSLSNQSYQEQGIDDRVSNNDAYDEDSNLVFISASNEDLGFEFEDTQPLDIETAAEEEKKVLFTGEEEESQVTTVNMDGPCKSSISSPGTNYDNDKFYVNSSGSAINNEKILQSKPTTRSASSSSNRPNKLVEEHKKSFQCNWPDCNAKLSNSYSLRRHKRIHTGEKPYVCPWPECGQRFTQIPHLIIHKRIHTGEKPYICDWPDCKQRFAQSGHLNIHKKTHTREKPFTSDWPGCGRQTTTARSRRRFHRKSLDTGQKQFVCDYPDCKKQFPKLKNLNYHKKRIHTDLDLGIAHEGNQLRTRSLENTAELICAGDKVIMDPNYDRISAPDDSKKDNNKREAGQEPLLQFKPLQATTATVHKKSFQCNWPGCNAKLSNSYSLTRHKIIHTGEKPYICDWEECGQRFSYLHCLTRHKRIHSEKLYICDWPDCKTQFNNRGNLNLHKLYHTGEKPFICDWPDCGQQFTRSNTLNNHKRIHADVGIELEGNQLQPRSHENTAEEKAQAVCTGDRVIKIEMDPNDERMWSSDYSKKGSSCGEDQEPLLQSKPPPATAAITHKISFECNWLGCNAKLSNSYTLRRHKKAHARGKSYICGWEECGQRFSYKTSLIIHKRSHTGENPHVCNLAGCGKGFTTSGSLINHKRIHTGEKPYICCWEECGQRFSYLYSLTRHKRFHTGEKPYICNWPDCNRRFTQSYHLVDHKRIHTCEKSYICNLPDCEQSFATRSGLNWHKRSHDRMTWADDNNKCTNKIEEDGQPEEESFQFKPTATATPAINKEPFVCDWPECNAKLSTAYSLTRHKRVHTGEKPFSCDLPDCNGQRRFSNLSGLNWHKRSHTNIARPETPAQCEQDNIVKVELDPFELNVE